MATKNAQQRAVMTAKEERARDAALAMREYEANKLAVRTNTARLRALRLAKEEPRQQVSGFPKRPRAPRAFVVLGRLEVHATHAAPRARPASPGSASSATL